MSDRHPLDFLDGARINLPTQHDPSLLDFLDGATFNVTALQNNRVYIALRNHQVILSGINLALAEKLLAYTNEHPKEFQECIRFGFAQAVGNIKNAAAAGYPDCYRIKYYKGPAAGGRIYGSMAIGNQSVGGAMKELRKDPNNYVYTQGLVQFKRFFKDTLFFYAGFADIDQSAAHPTFLLWLGEQCKKAGFDVTTDGLFEYITDNAGFVERFAAHYNDSDSIPLVRDDVKELITKRLFGYNFLKWQQDMVMKKNIPLFSLEDTYIGYRNFDRDLKSIQRALKELNPDYFQHLDDIHQQKVARHNLHSARLVAQGKPPLEPLPEVMEDGRFVSYALQTLEAVTTWTLVELLKERGLCTVNFDWGHDGVTIPRGPNVPADVNFADYLSTMMPELNQIVQERTGIWAVINGVRVGPTFVVKPFKICPAAREILEHHERQPLYRTGLQDEDPEVALTRPSGNEPLHVGGVLKGKVFCQGEELDYNVAKREAYLQARELFEQTIAFNVGQKKYRRVNRDPNCVMKQHLNGGVRRVSAAAECWTTEMAPVSVAELKGLYEDLGVTFEFMVRVVNPQTGVEESAEKHVEKFDFIKEYAKDPLRKQFQTATFEPWTCAMMEELGHRNYSLLMDMANRWTPFRYDYTAWYRWLPSRDMVWKMIRLVKHWFYIVGKEPKGWQYLARFIARAVQKPNCCPAAYILLASPPGSGKDTMLKHLMNMLGSHAYATTTDPGLILGEKNAFGRYATIVELNESSGAKLNEGMEHTLNSLVTDGVCTVRELYMDAVVGYRYHYIFRCTNDMEAITRSVTASAEDRRSVLYYCSPDKIGDFAYFRELDSFHIDEPVLITLMFWLQRLDLEGWCPAELYRSAYHHKVLKDCANPFLEFLAEIISLASTAQEDNNSALLTIMKHHKDSKDLEVANGKIKYTPTALKDAWDVYTAMHNCKTDKYDSHKAVTKFMTETFGIGSGWASPTKNKRLNGKTYHLFDIETFLPLLERKTVGRIAPTDPHEHIGPMGIKWRDGERERMDPVAAAALENIHAEINAMVSRKRRRDEEEGEGTEEE